LMRLNEVILYIYYIRNKFHRNEFSFIFRRAFGWHLEKCQYYPGIQFGRCKLGSIYQNLGMVLFVNAIDIS
jgi:hypothetical protein